MDITDAAGNEKTEDDVNVAWCPIVSWGGDNIAIQKGDSILVSVRKTRQPRSGASRISRRRSPGPTAVRSA